jgi:hypothetical protein
MSDAPQRAWDEAAGCPLGTGVSAVGVIRPDLPLQPGYRALSSEARVVFLVFAAEACHRVMRADAGVLAARSGLSVSAVHLALNELAAHRWIRIHAEIGPRIASATPEVFLGISAGSWAARTRRGH